MPGRDREDVGVEDDVLGREADLARQQVVGALADLDLALEGVGLALLVEGHHDRRGAVAPHEARLAQELGLALLHRDRIDDRLALHALQARLDHLPLRRVDHHRHARDVGLGGDQVEEPDHRRLRVEHRLVHVDVDDLRAAGDLLARDLHRAGVVAGEDQLGERARAGDVGALADVDEQRVVADGERLEAGEPHDSGPGRRRLHRQPPMPQRVPAQESSAAAGCCTASAIARMCAGVVPQQPPTRLTKPFRAKSSISRAVSAGVSS